MTITRQRQDAIGVTFEQDADEFFKEMAEPCIVIIPFGIDTPELADKVFGSWYKMGWLTEDALAHAKSLELPIEANTAIRSGHTKGYALMKRGRLGIEELDIQGMKLEAKRHEEATK